MHLQSMNKDCSYRRIARSRLRYNDVKKIKDTIAIAGVAFTWAVLFNDTHGRVVSEILERLNWKCNSHGEWE